MQTNDNVGDADGTDNFEDDGALDGIAGEIGAPWVDGFDVKIRDAPVPWTERRSKLG